MSDFDPTAYPFRCSYHCTAEDYALWLKWTAKLPVRPDGWPYHSGPDFVNKARLIRQITGAYRILEIGFNLGHSASVWLGTGRINNLVTSVESSDAAITLEAVDVVEKAAFANRQNFTFINQDSTDEDTYQWLRCGTACQLAFIDGDHSFEAVDSDIALCKRLGIPWIALDDWDKHHGPGVQDAAEKHGLMPVAIFPNVALCVDGDGWEKRF